MMSRGCLQSSNTECLSLSMQYAQAILNLKVQVGDQNFSTCQQQTQEKWEEVLSKVLPMWYDAFLFYFVNNV